MHNGYDLLVCRSHGIEARGSFWNSRMFLERVDFEILGAAADGFYTVALRKYTIKYYIFIFRPCKFVQTTRLAAINSL